MKKILTLLAIGIVGFTSCKEELVQVYSISIDPTELSFNSGGGEETVSVASTADWELSGDSYWCYASEYSGKGDAEIIFTADPNEDSESNRSATFTFTSGDKKATLTVTQEKKEYSISIEPKGLKFGADGGEQEITVTSSDEWKVKGESDWCDLSLTSGKNGDKVTFSADPYTNTEEARTATYTFVCGDKEVELTVTQEAKVYSISVEPMELTYIAAGEEKTVTITSSDEWKFSSDEYWITASEQSGKNGATVKIKVEENEDPEIRTGIATFRCGDKQTDVKIIQEAKEFTISIEPTEIEFEAEGGEQEITVKSSDSWRLSTDNDWITTSAKTGSNGDIVKIIVGYTASTEIRTGIITFTCGNKTAEFTVTQNPDDSPIIQFKDPYFLEALVNTKQVDKNEDGQISEKEALSTTELNLENVKSGHQIRNTEELSYFTSLESLEIKNVLATSLNLIGSGFPVLQNVIIYNGGLEYIDFSNCPLLEYANIEGQSYSPINKIDLSGCPLLNDVRLSGCKIIDLSNCKSIENFTQEDSDITEKIDVSNCISLKDLVCCNNTKLTSLNISNTVSLTKLQCYNDKIQALDLSSSTALTDLSCGGNQFTTLDLSNNTALTSLSCSNLTTLDVSKNTALTELDCSSCQLTTLDLSSNTALTILYCNHNLLTNLDLSNNTSLEYLNCSQNDITTLNLQNNTALTVIDCTFNKLVSLDLKNNASLETLYCYWNPQLKSLDVSSCHNLMTLTCVQYGHNSSGIPSIYYETACPLETLKIYKYHLLADINIKALESVYGDIIEYVE